MDRYKLLSDISDAFGPSGFEDEVVEVARNYISGKAIIKEDCLRNLYIQRPQDGGSGNPVVMLDAHSDEVGFMVQAVKPNGLLSIIPLGGWVNNTIPAHRVLVQNRDGELIPGIIATTPPHFMSEEQRNAPLDISAMYIDIGASSGDEVRNDYKIGIGAPAAPDTRFTLNEKNGLITGKAFDCRAGCACVIDVMNQLMDSDISVTPVGAIASQEEVGTRGAKVTAQTVNPDVAICFEGCPADDNFAEDWAIQTAIRKGPMLRHIDRGMITNPRFQRFALDIAGELNIPVQEAVRGGGMTNGAPIHLSGRGIPTIVIGIPVRYIHTHYGIATKVDFERSISLGMAVIERLNREVIEGF